MFTTPEHSLTRQFGSWTLFLFALVVSLLILINSTSRFFNAENPALALRINPLNAEARINLLALILSKDRTPDQFEVLEKLAISGTTLEPMDARFYSLLGMTHEILGEANAAQILYRHALRLLPTEIQALSRRFVFNFNDGNYVEAVSIVDIFSRRWRKHWNLISPHLPNLLDNEMAYDEAINRFSKQKNGIQILVSSLINQSNSLDLAHRMIMDWHKQGEKNLRNSINQLSNKLVANGQENKAYRLFRLTLNA
ncbi:MAG: hypothetical protein GY761_17660, partial [Hyphomicrobiales bacterium]|nr:hypothetical protein [Hyphomicrobiales bacterium]